MNLVITCTIFEIIACAAITLWAIYDVYGKHWTLNYTKKIAKRNEELISSFGFDSEKNEEHDD